MIQQKKWIEQRLHIISCTLHTQQGMNWSIIVPPEREQTELWQRRRWCWSSAAGARCPEGTRGCGASSAGGTRWGTRPRGAPAYNNSRVDTKKPRMYVEVITCAQQRQRQEQQQQQQRQQQIPGIQVNKTDRQTHNTDTQNKQKK